MSNPEWKPESRLYEQIRQDVLSARDRAITGSKFRGRRIRRPNRPAPVIGESWFQRLMRWKRD